MTSEDNTELRPELEIADTQGHSWLMRRIGWVVMLAILGGFFVLSSRARAIREICTSINIASPPIMRLAFWVQEHGVTIALYLGIVMFALNLVAAFASEPKRNLALMTLATLGGSMILFFFVAMEIPFFQTRSTLPDPVNALIDKYMPSFVDHITRGIAPFRPQAKSPGNGASGKTGRRKHQRRRCRAKVESGRLGPGIIGPTGLQYLSEF